MDTKELIRGEVLGGGITLAVCLRQAVLLAEFNKAKVTDEMTRIVSPDPERSLAAYGIKINQEEFDFRREVYTNVIKVLHDRIHQLDQDQAAYTRGMANMPMSEREG